MTEERTHIVYGIGFCVDVDPPEQASNVLNHIITGREFDGMENVVVKEVEPGQNAREIALKKAMTV